MQKSVGLIIGLLVSGILSAQQYVLKPIEGFFPSVKIYKKTIMDMTTNYIYLGTDFVNGFKNTTRNTIDLTGEIYNQIQTAVHEGTQKTNVVVYLDSGRDQVTPLEGELNFTLKLGEKGIIKSVEGSPEIIEALKSNPVSGMQEGLPYGIFLNTQTTRAVGDSWVDSSYYQYGIINYTFDSAVANIGYFSVNQEMDYTTKTNFSGVESEQTVVGTTSGNIQVDLSNNLITKLFYQMELTGNLLMSEYRIPLTMRGSISDKASLKPIN